MYHFTKLPAPKTLITLPGSTPPITDLTGYSADTNPTVAAFPATVASTGQPVSVTVLRSGINPGEGVPVYVQVIPGSDGILTSLLYPPAGPAGDALKGTTDATGTFRFTIKPMINGEADELVIIVNENEKVAGLGRKDFKVHYATTVP